MDSKIMEKNEGFKIINGDSLKVLDTLEPNSIDAIVTDPPYGLTSITKRFGKEGSAPAQYGKDGSFARLSKGFMGKEWDGSGIEYNVELWEKALKVLKPGGFLLAFGGSRTFYRIAVAIEDAGFEIRDTIMWLYGSGFPKSLNIGLAIDKKNGVESKVVGTGKSGKTRLFGGLREEEHDTSFEIKKASNKWDGWGTCLKPAFEPIIVARKPCENSITDNVLKYGVGGINIDECRVEFGKETDKRIGTDAVNTSKCGFWSKDKNNGETQMYKDNGRFPANVILTYDETDKDEVCGGMPNSKSSITSNDDRKNIGNSMFIDGVHNELNSYNDEGSAARYFYCAKASKKDRDSGLIEFENISGAKITGRKEGSAGLVMENGKQNPFAGKASPNNKNIHPTVKPVELMQYLVRLVTPAGGGCIRYI